MRSRGQRLGAPGGQSQAAWRRRRAGSGRRVWLALAATAALFAVAFGAVRLYTSAFFVISNVTVTGASAIGEDAVRDAAALGGQRYFLANTAAAVARVEALPWVKDAHIVRRFPNGATIAINERRPAGVWQIGAVAYLVDDEGKVLDAATATEALPVLDASFAGGGVRVGDHVNPDPVKVATRVTDFVPNVLGQKLTRLQYDMQSGVTAFTERGVVVRLGDSQNLDYKLSVWKELTSSAGAADIHEIDLRYGDRPYYR